jgi:hypothetical protein
MQQTATTKPLAHPHAPARPPAAADRRLKLVVITHDDGEDHYLARSHTEAMERIGEYVREWWEDEAFNGHVPAQMPDDPAKAIKDYFEGVRAHHEFYEIYNVDPPACDDASGPLRIHLTPEQVRASTRTPAHLSNRELLDATEQIAAEADKLGTAAAAAHKAAREQIAAAVVSRAEVASQRR